jgi:hypothetical protein
MDPMLAKLTTTINDGRLSDLPSEQIARNFLNAMRQPSPEMWEAWTAKMPRSGYITNGALWESMIEAALEPDS